MHVSGLLPDLTSLAVWHSASAALDVARNLRQNRIGMPGATRHHLPQHRAGAPGALACARRVAACVAALALLLGAGAAAAADGARLYREHCASCHGPDGRGDGPDAALFVQPPRDLRDGVLTRYPLDALTVRVLDGRELQLLLDPAAMHRRATDVEALIAWLHRLPTVDWPRADHGRAVYLDRCAACHGLYGTPPSSDLPAGVRTPRSLSDPALQARPDAALIEAVRHGRRGMPALVPRLTADEAGDVAVFVRLFSPGFQTYTQYCAACHGDHGIPQGSFAEERAQPTVLFDAAYFARQDPEVLRARVWHMLAERQPAMPHFRGTLSADEVRAILISLRP